MSVLSMDLYIDLVVGYEPNKELLLYIYEATIKFKK